MTGRTALITGASSGIGLELAKCFAMDGWSLILASRRTSELEKLGYSLQHKHGVSVQSFYSDLSLPEAPGRLFEELQTKGAAVHALVNNAGVGSFGLFADSDLTVLERLLQLNMNSLAVLTRLFLPGMVRAGSGYVLNVASTAAFQPGPLMAAYYASKAFVLSLSEALQNELQNTGVSVTTLCPGATHTGFQEAAKMQSSRILKMGVMNAENVARAGYRGMLKRKTLVVPGLKNKILAAGVRLAPRSWVPPVVRKIQEADKAALDR